MESRKIQPFLVQVDAATVADVQERLARTRWPDELDGTDWAYGTDRSFLQDLCRYWRESFDWDRFEKRCNAWPQFTTTIDGQQIHFLHARSPEPNARPLLLTHGWPGSVAEFFDVLGPLCDPARYGGDPNDAFHVVAPSLPGFGFSGPTTEPGWDAHRVARAFADLMGDLGYERFYAQGGDWGSLITMSLAGQFPERVAAAHVNLLVCGPPKGGDPTEGLTEAELAGVAATAHFGKHESGYQAIQGTKPQTLAYALMDSPAGLAGWIVEKFRTWSDCGGDVLSSFTFDRLLENISIYWITGTINSSMRLYYEAIGPGRATPAVPLRIPLGYAAFPAEIYRTPRRWAEAAFPTLVHWGDMARGGHFAAMEEPELFVGDVRAFFGSQSLSPRAE
jgi:pimeloyl-ACP methyl ester carboxylesterase